MDARAIEVFLRKLGCDRIKSGASWVSSTCPLAPFRHSGGRDSRPSFGVRIDPAGESRCRCLACGYHGPLVPLLWRLGRPDLVEFAITNNAPGGTSDKEASSGDLAGRISKVSYWSQPIVQPVAMPVPRNPPLDATMLRDYQPMPSDVLAYLTVKRGFNIATLQEWEIGYNRAKARITIPIRDEDGNLVAVSGRAYKGQEPKYLHSRFSRDLVLYGEHLVTPGGVGYLTEGFFQAMAIADVGVPGAVGRMGTHLSRWQRDKLVRLFSLVVVVEDGDAPGRKSAAEIVESLSSRVPTVRLTMPDGMDADTIPRNDLISRLASISQGPAIGLDDSSPI